ncbi:MAG: hypothetical protein ISS15_21720 [Alphaproteobacteria bacterium]|jgi:hypothetical protein|uniref:hypothetical protein n=1 Tax=Bradyrhizobium manausense TaxID=989370 RepID=UPI000B7115E1|nr:hypothetical protein [Bradyrhizobium manausense]MAH70466.1 hypothetical protein [Afipia sp.]MBL7100286.1 hypothetical protein [Alphaproteobacteria bacterium]OUX59121.1 MAG: hypothetical protein CBB64_21710 [Afipia sp. TMED4]HBP83702.1 hypothetical protein [Gammaproteobacteria bacterium]MAH71828.1 hypothetical protein [Afipia sp.]|tara:strand:- start:3277 stop:3543 length:267 start_codon:yes stop_codon:yes gene_type:complete
MSINNIVFLRGNVAAPALHMGQANIVIQDRRAEHHRCADAPRAANRVVPIMIWHTNPVSNRPECRWVMDRSAATDEGVSCSDTLRRAA